MTRTTFPVRTATRFGVLFVVVYALGVMAWGTVGPAWTSFYQASGTAVFDGFRGKGMVSVQPYKQTRPEDPDTQVVLTNVDLYKPPQVPVVLFELTSRYTGYTDLVFFFALWMATPMTLRRRLVGGLAGWTVLELASLGRLGVAIAYHYDTHPHIGLANPEGPWRDLIAGMYRAFAANQVEAGYVLGIALWASLGVSPEQWRSLLGGHTNHRVDVDPIG